MTIRTKLISGFGGLLLLIILVFSAITYLTFGDIIHREGEEVLQLRAQEFLLHLNREMGREYRAFHQARRRWRTDSDHVSKQRARVETGPKTPPAPAGLFERVRPVSEHAPGMGVHLPRPLASALLKEFATRPAGPSLRLVRTSAGIYLGELLHDGDGKVDGVLAARLDPKELRAFLTANRKVTGAELALSYHGQLLATSAPGPSDPPEEGELPSLLWPSWGRPNHVLSTGAYVVLSSETTEQGLQVSYILPKMVFLKDLSALKNRILAAILILGYIAVWVVLVIAHRITRPIVDLSRASRDIISFNYETPVTVLSRNDEIGVMGESFETMRRKIKELVVRDPLTQTYNRRYLLHALETAVEKAVRLQEGLACIMLDLDHFKGINDRYGHPCGDTILEALGNLLIREVRPYDTVARYGGEEFTVLLPNTDAAMALQVAERLKRAVEETDFPWQGKTVRCTLSLGLSTLRPTDGHAFEPLIERADQALYAAKAAGRNRIVVHRDEADGK